ncbi:hypothetical protein SAMN04487972_103180 [Paracoccus halophilus]|uniref:Uncharacterized protein n=1 Tax=Paracoccus halophilus TaxID=376733 RepID=A0A099F1C9_9RHOB|nr:hypothetical protein [Paracoccus halophilus]KGJ04048.1 hypothetical protein IT41_12160 [Paracoccus halophilus]SFA44230.1 hypothetical protein SAMN04487972_103180 [Paracoccus halophilus]
MKKPLVLSLALTSGILAAWYWQQGGLSLPDGARVIAEGALRKAAPEGPASPADQAEAAAEAVIAAANSAAPAGDAPAPENAMAPPPTAAFVDIGKMRDIVESSQSMAPEVKADILRLLDASALDPARLDEALVKYRAALQ